MISLHLFSWPFLYPLDDLFQYVILTSYITFSFASARFISIIISSTGMDDVVAAPKARMGVARSRQSAVVSRKPNAKGYAVLPLEDGEARGEGTLLELLDLLVLKDTCRGG